MSSIRTLLLLALSVQSLASPAVDKRTTAAASVPPIVSISVDASVQYQELDGFGVSEAFQRAEDVLGKGGLNPAQQDEVLDLLFSLDKGAGFTILRNGIGSSNSSASNYMNSIEPVSPGHSNFPPHYVWDGYDSGQFPLAQKAYARGLQTLYGDAWSAPGYMKTNGDDSNGGYICGVSDAPACATGNWMQAYADYLLQWARFYRQSGVKVTTLGFLNEPQYEVNYASMLSNGTQAAEFIRVLAKTIRESDMPYLQIACCDGIGWEQQEQMMAGLQAGPDPAEAYLSVVTGHGYSSPPNTPLTTGQFNTKTWLTEWADLSGGYTPYTFWSAANGPGEGLTWAMNIQVALVNANVSGFLYWIGAENATSNSALISLIGSQAIVPSKRFWAFAQFSKFARPGARRIDASVGNLARGQVTASSFLNADGRIATQVINNSSMEYRVSLSLSFKTRQQQQYSSVTPYLTDNSNNLTTLVSVRADKNGVFETVIPARSLVTLLTD